jgi:hypothetical protein
VTHEYVIGLGGRIEPRGPVPGEAAHTAIGWAADRVLAVGSDDVVRSISRGDSTFLGLRGCVVTALPDDPVRADVLVRRATRAGDPDLDIGALLIDAGLLYSDAILEPGSPADLAFWGASSASGAPDGASEGPAERRLVAVVRGGAFTEGDEHRGPFQDDGNGSG